MVAYALFAAEREWFLERYESVMSLDAVLDGDDVHADVESSPTVRTHLFLLHGGNQRTSNLNML